MAVAGRKTGISLNGKGRAVDSEDTDIVGHKARREMEEFINRHLHDHAKGWPVSCRFGPDYTGSRQVQEVPRRGEQTHKRISA